MASRSLNKSFRITLLLVVIIITAIIIFNQLAQSRAAGLFELPNSKAPFGPIEDPYSWYKYEQTWIVASSLDAAIQIAEETEAAKTSFEELFGVKIGTGAVFHISSGLTSDTLTRNGITWAMPYNDAFIGADQTQQQLRELGFATLLRHEIAHILFIRYIWPNSRGSQYGGDAPDWVDEIAAILAEDPVTTARRRENLYHISEQGKLIPWSEFFQMTNPLYRTPEKNTEGVQIQSRTYRVKRGELPLSAVFYAQTRGLIDFLESYSNDPQIFSDLIIHLKNNKPLEDWISNNINAENQSKLNPLTAFNSKFETWLSGGKKLFSD